MGYPACWRRKIVIRRRCRRYGRMCCPCHKNIFIFIACFRYTPYTFNSNFFLTSSFFPKFLPRVINDFFYLLWFRKQLVSRVPSKMLVLSCLPLPTGFTWQWKTLAMFFCATPQEHDTHFALKHCSIIVCVVMWDL